MFRRLRNYFITGLVVILPAILTFVIFWYIIIKTNEWILAPITDALIQATKPFLPDIPKISFAYLDYIIKFLVLILILALIIFVGLATRLFIIRKSFEGIENLLLKVPMVGKVYLSIKQLSGAFLGQQKGIFEKVALLEYPRKGVYSIGFVTSRVREEIQLKTKPNMINVFVPTTPNPTSGVFLLVPEDDLIYLDMTIEEGLRLVVSGGKVTPGYKKQQ